MPAFPYGGRAADRDFMPPTLPARPDMLHQRPNRGGRAAVDAHHPKREYSGVNTQLARRARSDDLFIRAKIQLKFAAVLLSVRRTSSWLRRRYGNF
jgi:hypothetical protein